MIKIPILRVNRFQRINFNGNAGVNIMVEEGGGRGGEKVKRGW